MYYFRDARSRSKSPDKNKLNVVSESAGESRKHRSGYVRTIALFYIKLIAITSTPYLSDRHKADEPRSKNSRSHRRERRHGDSKAEHKTRKRRSSSSSSASWGSLLDSDDSAGSDSNPDQLLDVSDDDSPKDSKRSRRAHLHRSKSKRETDRPPPSNSASGAIDAKTASAKSFSSLTSSDQKPDDKLDADKVLYLSHICPARWLFCLFVFFFVLFFCCFFWLNW